MPHQVTKATARGSQGDLAKIADALHKLKPPVNIVAIGGGEGVLNNANGTKTEVGVISMILEPDDGATSDKILTTLRGLTLPSGKKLEDVEQFPNIHIQIDDKPGELKKALDALTGINIRSVLSMGTFMGTANVGLGVAETDQRECRDEAQGQAHQGGPAPALSRRLSGPGVALPRQPGPRSSPPRRGCSRPACRGCG